MTAPLPGQTDPAIIRNFCIIAHIDHGKSTLADRMLQLTGVVDERSARAQYLDRMDIERERGITIKSQAVRMPWTVPADNVAGAEPGTYVLNMIDTPGHVDFTYEVSRSLEACEAAILLVDAAQGIEAQTLANLYLAMGADLHIIPVLNKIDLPGANPEKYAAELAGLVGCEPEDVLRVSAKTGVGVSDLLNEIVQQTPPPVGDADKPARALIFDSVYDTYRGVITYVRVVDGKLNHRDRIKMMSTGATHEMCASRAWVTPSPPRTTAPPRRWAATSTPTRWSTPVSTRSTATSSATCARRWRSSSSTTPRSPTSRRPPARWASASAAASSGCCTWRSPGTGSSGSSAST